MLQLLDPNENNELKSVLENTFTGLKNLFDNKQCNFLEGCEIIDSNIKSFDSYFELSKSSYKEVLENKNDIISDLIQLSKEKLKEVGLVGSQLKLKIKLYRDQLNRVVSLGGKFYNFKSKKLQILFIGVIDILLDLLASLAKILPSLEPLLEFLQCIRTIIKMMANNRE
jgi:hypothetical protein